MEPVVAARGGGPGAPIPPSARQARGPPRHPRGGAPLLLGGTMQTRPPGMDYEQIARRIGHGDVVVDESDPCRVRRPSRRVAQQVAFCTGDTMFVRPVAVHERQPATEKGEAVSVGRPGRAPASYPTVELPE